MKTSAKVIVCLLCMLSVTVADEYKVEVLRDGLPKDQLSDEITARLSPEGIRVVQGTDRTVCEIWICKDLAAKPDFTATSEIRYPFENGQLIGALRFRRKSGDFRDQQISRGVYTLRHIHQPIDGNHVGTSPTRDFLVMVNAEDDKTAPPVETEQLLEASAKAAGTSHPAMMCLKKLDAPAADTPIVHHDEFNDWWILRFAANAEADARFPKLTIDLVVVGHATE